MKPIKDNIIVKRIVELDSLENGLIFPSNLSKSNPIASHVIVALGDWYGDKDRGYLPKFKVGDIVFCAKGCGTDFDYIDRISERTVNAKLVEYCNVVSYKKSKEELKFQPLNKFEEDGTCTRCGSKKGHDIVPNEYKEFACEICGAYDLDIIPVRDVVLLAFSEKPKEHEGFAIPTVEEDFIGGTFSKRELWEQEALVVGKGPGYYDKKLGCFIPSEINLKVGDTVRVPKSLPSKWFFEYKGIVIAYAGEQDCWGKNSRTSA